eukprot:CAMPEP_0204634344 /NCGR_PEP_ID=MMETSP0717-20131115/29037_1 /ASSEMBLY_ACC=CAM_ASM_000666 /TAXON_ID=230516 /ORGANISM="Chaetoceros curvisetus" /LENGTH=396 /DNA_ID=CAMNT_0051652749 /DNA_START=50 /DNA_END=1240 /DNA_ORIENTATION=+
MASTGALTGSSIPPASKDGRLPPEMNELPVHVKREGGFLDTRNSSGEAPHAFQGGAQQFFPPNSQTHYGVNSGVGAPSLQGNDYFNNMQGLPSSSMQTHFAPTGPYGYSQPDPYYYSYLGYGAQPTNANYLDPTASSIPGYEASMQLNDNKKRSLNPNGSDLQQQGNLFQSQDKRMRVGNEIYPGFSGHYNDYGGPTQQIMALQQHGNFLQTMENSTPIQPPAKPVKPVKAKKQYSGDMPRRPLTAYNFFFSEEREFILAQLPGEEEVKKQKDLDSAKSDAEKGNDDAGEDNKKEVDPMEKILASMRELSEEETKELRIKVRANTEKMLTVHKESDRVKKPHKKVHGKIPFRYLAKIVGSRWRSLLADEKKTYEDIAAKDSSRYNEQLAEYNKNNK